VLITRASVLDLIDEQFVVTARAKGLSPARILLTYELPNAINPVLSFLGIQVGTLMGGSIITETIYVWPGVTDAQPRRDEAWRKRGEILANAWRTPPSIGQRPTPCRPVPAKPAAPRPRTSSGAGWKSHSSSSIASRRSLSTLELASGGRLVFRLAATEDTPLACHSNREPDMSNESLDAAREAVGRAIHEHWKLFLIEGIILVVLGLLAIAVPPLAGLTITILFGWLFLISGVAGLVTTFMMRQAPGFWWSLISAALGVLVGGWLIAQPGLGMVSLTYLLIAFFIIEGVVTIMYALEHRRELSGRWGWMLTSGVVDLLLAAIIVSGLPGTIAWALGLIVGINLVFGGASMIGMALAARSAA
jgi:uncharacterized membrane protein HdeD (DUF308 family)